MGGTTGTTVEGRLRAGLSPDAATTATAPTPSPWGVFGDPAATFDALAVSPNAGPALRWLLLSMPVMPLALALGSAGGVRRAMLADPDLAARADLAPFISASAGLLALLMQAFMLLVHLALFVATTRWLRDRSPRRTVVALWSFAVFPLVLRQALLLCAVLVKGPEWFQQHASLLGVLDPFLPFVGVLFYLGCRRVLGMSVKRAAVAAVSASVIGALGVLGAALG